MYYFLCEILNTRKKKNNFCLKKARIADILFSDQYHNNPQVDPKGQSYKFRLKLVFLSFYVCINLIMHKTIRQIIILLKFQNMKMKRPKKSDLKISTSIFVKLFFVLYAGLILYIKTFSLSISIIFDTIFLIVSLFSSCCYIIYLKTKSVVETTLLDRDVFQIRAKISKLVRELFKYWSD